MSLTFEFGRKSAKPSALEQSVTCYEKHETGRTITFVATDGYHLCLHYGQVNATEYMRGKQEIVIRTAQSSIRLRGQKLDDLFNSLTEQRVRRIRVVESRYAATEDNGAVVTRMDIAPVKPRPSQGEASVSSRKS